MSESQTRVQKRTDDNDALELIHEAERSRTTVRRVRELLEGIRDPATVKAGDWFETIDYVRSATGTELVLYTESDDSATIRSLDETGLWCIVAGWSEQAEFHRSKMARWDVEESLRFFQREDSTPELLALEDAKQRVKSFAEAHE